MILQHEIDININNSNYKYYKELGYDTTKKTLTIKTKDLSKGSNVKINVKCDICGCIKCIKYNSLIKNNYIDNYLCIKCKRKKNLLEKYGVENIFQLEKIKEKIKEINKKKRNVEYVSQSEEIKEKIKKKSIEKYGVDHHLKSNIVKEKRIITCLEKYGVDNVSKIGDIKRKKENTCYKNFGVKYISQRDIFKEIVNNKNINKLKIKYDIDLIGIDDNNFFIRCNMCNKIFDINKKSFYTRHKYNTMICTLCNPINSFSTSGQELLLQEFIKNNYDNNIILNSRNIIFPYEIDIYIPDLKIAFEFNGLFWHNEINVSKNYHMIKTEMCEQNNIKLIHIYEDDWIYKQDIVKSRILNLLGKSIKIYSRNCDIRLVSPKDTRKFLLTNHIQGYVSSRHNIGLYYNNEIVSLMTFGKKRKIMNYSSLDGEYEMTRFCSKLNYNVIGGASRLFKYFIKMYKPINIISYADRSWSTGNLYEKLGFQFMKKTQPNYFYIVDGIRKHRFGFRKDKLIKEGFDSNKTEHQIMKERKIYRIYDSGHMKFLFNIS